MDDGGNHGRRHQRLSRVSPSFWTGAAANGWAQSVVLMIVRRRSVGIDWESWTADEGMHISDGAVFWMNAGAQNILFRLPQQRSLLLIFLLRLLLILLRLVCRRCLL